MNRTIERFPYQVLLAAAMHTQRGRPGHRPFARRFATPQNLKSRDGRVYRRLVSGQIVRVSPQRPWHGKSERRRAIAMRRANREAAATNLQEAE